MDGWKQGPSQKPCQAEQCVTLYPQRPAIEVPRVAVSCRKDKKMNSSVREAMYPALGQLAAVFRPTLSACADAAAREPWR